MAEEGGGRGDAEYVESRWRKTTAEMRGETFMKNENQVGTSTRVVAVSKTDDVRGERKGGRGGRAEGD